MTTTRAIPETLPGNQTSGRKPGGGPAAPELRSGWTTGACATAATAAAFTALATGRFPERVEITLPRATLRTGQRPVFDVAELNPTFGNATSWYASKGRCFNIMSVSQLNIGLRSIPAFGDLNGDSKCDMIVGMENGNLIYFQNNSSMPDIE